MTDDTSDETETKIQMRSEATHKEAGGNRQKAARSVEECLWISVGHFRYHRQGRWRPAGALQWVGERSGRVTGAARYRINGCSESEPGQKVPANSSGGPVLLLAGAGPAQAIRFRSSAVRYGNRYYFICPVCERSFGKLFLPPGSEQFACRLCHRLRYQSQRHECDFFFRPMSDSTGIPKRLLKQYFRGSGQPSWKEILS